MKELNISHAGSPDGLTTPSHQNLPIRILVVDDELSIRQLSSKVLTQSGYHVDAAEDGAAGWDALQASSYDLLITDNNMPKVSGVELVKMLRSAGMTLPAVMVSATLPPEALNGDSSLQLAATLVKPFTMQELLGTIENILRTAEVTPGHTVPLPAMAGAA
jgi:DNA-binding response OmpR family regulator